MAGELNQELLSASEEGNATEVSALLAKGADVNAMGPGLRKYGRPVNNTALYIASRMGHPEVVKILLSKNANVNATMEDGETALTGAIETAASRSEDPAVLLRLFEVVKLLLKAGARVNVQDSYGTTPLMAASKLKVAGCEMVKLLLDAKADVNHKTKYGTTALTEAFQLGRIDVVRLLIEAKADVNARPTSGETLLFMACDREDIDIAKMLIAAKADVNAKINEGMTALWMAAVRGNLDLVKILVAAGADVNAELKNGHYILSGISRESRHRDVFNFLCAKGAKDDKPAVEDKVTDNDLNKLFEVDVREHPEKIKKILDDKPTLLNYQHSHSGNTALMFAASLSRDRDSALIKYLLDRGADPDIKANNGFTALYHAASRGNVEGVRLLLSGGADPTIPIFSGKIAIEIAADNRHREIVTMLESAPAPHQKFISTKAAVGTTSSHDTNGCFIATACYGAYAHPSVVELRWFRDHCMRGSFMGREFIRIYYRVSPPVATFLTDHPALAKLVRVCCLRPILYMVTWVRERRNE